MIFFKGFDKSQQDILISWAQGGESVSLRFFSEEKCDFLKEIVKTVESSENKNTIEGSFGAFGFSNKVVTNITEYLWNFTLSFKLIAFAGKFLMLYLCHST